MTRQEISELLARANRELIGQGVKNLSSAQQEVAIRLHSVVRQLLGEAKSVRRQTVEECVEIAETFEFAHNAAAEIRTRFGLEAQ